MDPGLDPYIKKGSGYIHDFVRNHDLYLSLKMLEYYTIFKIKKKILFRSGFFTFSDTVYLIITLLSLPPYKPDAYHTKVWILLKEPLGSLSHTTVEGERERKELR